MRSAVGFAALLLLASAVVGAAHAQSVSKCVETLVKETRFTQERTVDVQARANPPEWRCKTIRASAKGCVRAAEGFAIAGAPEVRKISCIRERCSADPVTLEERDGRTVGACVTVRAWSGSGCFASGGRALYRLSAQVERAIRADEMYEFVKQCESQ